MVEIAIASTTTVEVGQISRTRAASGLRTARAIVFRALRLVPGEVPAGERGAQAAREYCRSVERAWDRKILDLEGRSWELQERLIRAGDLSRLYGRQTVQEAFALLHEVCPQLFVRVNHSEFWIPLGELRQEGPRLAKLDQWCSEVERKQRNAELRLNCRDIHAPRLSRIRESLHSRLRRYERAPAIPTAPPVHPEAALAAAEAELVRLGPAVEGEEGDRRTFVAACVGDDFGLTDEEFRPLLEDWNTSCSPPWSPRELEKKLASARRNRKRPLGYRVDAGSGTFHEGMAEETGNMRPVSKDRSHASGLQEHVSCADVWASAWRLNDPSARESDVGAAIAWASRRGLDPARLAERDLLRVLPRRGGVEARCCRFDGEFWSESGYRLIFSTWNAQGQLVGLRARHCDGAEAAVSATGEAPKKGAKELNPQGYSPSGTVFANAAGVELLRGGRFEVCWVAEGGPDFATLATLLPEGVPVIGIFAGSWTAELAEKLGMVQQVVLATDADRAGRRYAREIGVSLATSGWPLQPPRVMVLNLPDGSDVNSALRLGRLDLGSCRPFGLVPKTPLRKRRVMSEPGRSWEDRALGLLASYPLQVSGTPRELARALLLADGAKTTPGHVRGLERALVRLRETHRLPPGVDFLQATPLPLRPN